jgi:hypothetical protein
MRFTPIAALAFAAIACVPDAGAQSPSRTRSRGEMSREDSPRNAQRAPAFEPYAALERELPSLKADLKLAPPQLDAWNVFERDVRHAAELERARLRQQMALRDVSRELPAAMTLAQGWADFDRRKSEATADLVRHLATLQELLDDSQRRMLDRRIALSQTEPLGN